MSTLTGSNKRRALALTVLLLALVPVIVEVNSSFCDGKSNECSSPRTTHGKFRFKRDTDAVEAYTFVIRGASVIDGSGSDAVVQDVAVSVDKIAAVGNIDESLINPLTEIVDGKSYFLTPGFIDSHTHNDVEVLRNPYHEASKLQGVTSLIVGNCGFSTYPNGDSNELVRQHLRLLLGNVDAEDFSADFAAYQQKMVAGIGLNVASLVGHGPIRISVMGYEQREATRTEINQMTDLLELQLQQGALGMSLGLVYPPSAYAGQEELVALAKVVARNNKLLSGHIRSYEGTLLDSVGEFLQILRLSGARGILSHLQVAGKPYWNSLMDEALALVQRAREEDKINVFVDMYPYLAGSSTILQLFPPSSQSGGLEAFLDKLEDTDFVGELQNMTEGGREPGWESKIALIGYENVVIGSVVREELQIFEGMSLVDGAHALSVHEFDFLLYMTIEDYGQTNIIMFQQSEEDNNKVFQFPYQMVGSDSIPREGGKPHPRGFGTFPKVIGRMTNQGILRIEEAVRKCTSLPAQTYNIPSRGLLKVGYFADLVLFSGNFTDFATYDKPTLPPEGVLGVWVNGIKIVEEDKGINELPGSVIL